MDSHQNKNNASKGNKSKTNSEIEMEEKLAIVDKVEFCVNKQKPLDLEQNDYFYAKFLHSLY